METPQLAADSSARRCSAFPSELLGSFPSPTPEEIAARELAEDYHRVTEEYDRAVCTGPTINGSIRPACTQEISDINRFARLAFHNRLEKAIAQGVTPKQFQRAIADAAHRMPNPGHQETTHLVRRTLDGVVGTPNQKGEK